LTVNTAAAGFGEAVTFTAQLSGQPPAGSAAPTGAVQFLEGSTVIGAAALTNGVAKLTVSNLPPGPHQILAVYAGDAHWSSATSKLVALAIGKIPTATSLSLSTSGSAPDQLTLTARVAPGLPGAGAPGGTVQFLNNRSNTVLATVTLAAGTGAATVPLTTDP